MFILSLSEMVENQNLFSFNPRNKCKNSHDLKSAHNSVLLKNRNLQFLEEAQLFQLLLQNDPSLVPEVRLACM